MDLVQVRSVRNANMLEEPAVYSSQIPNFEVESSRLMLQQYGSFPHSLVDNNDIHNSPQKEVHVGLGNWRNSAPHQVTTDNWIVNYSNNSLPTDHHLNNNVDYAYHHQQLSTVMHHHTPSPLYQNTSMISSHVSDMASLMQQQQTDNQVTWVGNVCELESWKNPQSLSLSLSTQSKVHVTQFEEGCSSDNNIIQCVKYSKPSIISRDSGKSLEEVVGLGTGASKSTTTSYRNLGPLGPFTGYATILKSSRFLKTAQQLLDEFCCIPGLRTCDPSTSADNNETGIACKGSNAGSSLSSSMFRVSNENGADWGVGRSFGVSNSRPDYQQKKAKLLYMQEEVIKRYKQYHQQMQMVFSSFESVAGLGSATPYISLALKSVSKHFRCLNNSISEQLNRISEVLGEDSSLPTTSTSSKLVDDTNMASLKCMDQSLPKNKHGRGKPSFFEPRQHVWRPQRGFPESSVTILKAWLFEHFLHPYPTDTDKHMLATQTGLSRNQVSNWFINARVRVWKPLVEEIHTLDKNTTGASESYSKNEGTSGTKGSSSQVRVDKSMSKLNMHSLAENQYQEGIEEWSREKRSKLECQMSSSMDGNGSVMSFLPYSSGEVGGIGSVSLTLGLRHGVEGVQQLQEGQLRHYFGGQMIHDFVG